MRRNHFFGLAVLVAAVIGALVFLRPTRSGREHLPEAARIPPAAREVLRGRMQRHADLMRSLVSNVILLDDDAAARAAGAIYDEPTLARPLAGDELNGLLPERFFVLQDDLKSRARALVEVLARHDRRAVAAQLGALTTSCVECHDAYLHSR
jgi:hypothetical protein